RAVRSWSAASLILAWGLYFAIGLGHLDLPGLQADEGYDAAVALGMRDPGEARWAIAPVASLEVGGRAWPLMLHPHVGPTGIYLSAAGLALLGVSVEALRVTQLSVGALSLGLLWLLANRWFGAATAAVAVLFCGTAPAFVWWNRGGNNW